MLFSSLFLGCDRSSLLCCVSLMYTGDFIASSQREEMIQLGKIRMFFKAWMIDNASCLHRTLTLSYRNERECFSNLITRGAGFCVCDFTVGS